MLRWKRAFQGLSASVDGHDRMAFKAIDAVMGIFLTMLDIGAMHGMSGDLLRRELNRSVFVNPEIDGNLLSDISLLADYRFGGVISYLRRTGKRLNENDLKFCSLLCFRTSAIGMMKLYNHTNPACYYNRRGRIMRRIGLPKGKHTLERFLFETMESLSPTKQQ